MIYKQFQDVKLSALGLGCMRLPVIGGDDKQIDEALTEKMVAYALEHGINYFDTAYGYHGGNSERVIGRVLSHHPRDSFYLASKYPGYTPVNWDKVTEIFPEQLEKCGVDHFDFYLFHNVTEVNVEAYRDDEKYGIMPYLRRQKAEGRIRHLGFSCHGGYDTLKRFLDTYRDDLEFCQLQLNYLDWIYQKADERVALLQEYGLPIWVMEPVRGGRLATLKPEEEAILKELRPEETVPGWAFRFVQSIPGVTMILSGMSNMQQLEDNIATFETEEPLNEEEKAALLGISSGWLDKILPCTACRYCTTYCPQELDIPKLLSVYNGKIFNTRIGSRALQTFPRDKWPTECLGCRSCEAVCPQGIKISEVMADFTSRLHME